MSLKIVFMGTPEFSMPTLEALIKNKFNSSDRLYSTACKIKQRTKN